LGEQYVKGERPVREVLSSKGALIVIGKTRGAYICPGGGSMSTRGGRVKSCFIQKGGKQGKLDPVSG